MKRFLHNLFGFKGIEKAKPRPGRGGFQPRLEALEARALATVRVFHPGLTAVEWDGQLKLFEADVVRPGILTITSDNAGDNVQVFKSAHEVSVVVNRLRPDTTFGSELSILYGPSHLVTGVRFEGNGGNNQYENFTNIPDLLTVRKPKS